MSNWRAVDTGRWEYVHGPWRYLFVRGTLNPTHAWYRGLGAIRLHKVYYEGTEIFSLGSDLSLVQLGPTPDGPWRQTGGAHGYQSTANPCQIRQLLAEGGGDTIFLDQSSELLMHGDTPAIEIVSTQSLGPQGYQASYQVLGRQDCYIQRWAAPMLAGPYTFWDRIEAVVAGQIETHTETADGFYGFSGPSACVRFLSDDPPLALTCEIQHPDQQRRWEIEARDETQVWKARARVIWHGDLDTRWNSPLHVKPNAAYTVYFRVRFSFDGSLFFRNPECGDGSA